MLTKRQAKERKNTLLEKKKMGIGKENRFNITKKNSFNQ
jgi:hypothetical protein